MKIRILALLLAGAGALYAQIPEVKIPLVEKRWIKDDVLTKQFSTPWSFGAVFRGFVKLGKNDQDAVKDTQVRLFHDKEKLYFAFFRTVETTPSCVTAARDGGVWTDDCVSLFISPDAAQPAHFYQIVINANGVVYDEERFPGGKFDTKKDFRTLKTNIFKGERAWLLYGSIDLAELGIRAGKKFAFNLTSHRNEPDGTEEYSTFAPLARPQFLVPESFIPASLGGTAYNKPAAYSFGRYPELCLDGEGEFGTSERWVRRNGASVSPWYKGSGSHSISVINKERGMTRNWFHALDLKPGKRYMLSFFCRYKVLETGNLVPVRIHCYDRGGKVLAVIDGPGLGNLGGGVPNYRFAPYKKDFTTPAGTVRTELEVRVVEPGSINLDAISVKEFVPVSHVPVLQYPAENEIIRRLRVDFKWKLFARDDLRPGTLTLQFSKDAAFPENRTITFDGCAYDPADTRGWYEDLPEPGKWFWRARFDGEDGGVWSKTSSFIIDFDQSNEKISPVISGLSPRGRMAERAPEYRITFTDGKISSGIKEVKLLLNRKDVSADAAITDQGITFTLPEDGKTFYEVQLFVTDNNGNKAEENDFIAIMPGKGRTVVDSKGFIAVDGQRIFPISGYAYEDSKEFPAMKKFGYNSNMTPWVTPVNPACWRIIADCTRAGLYMIPITLPEFLWGKGYIKTDTRAARRFLEKEAKYVAKLQGHPGGICFYLGDESIDGGYKMDRFQEYYRVLKAACPDLPMTWLPTYGQNNKFAWTGAVKACDAFWHDDYVSQRNQHLHMIPDIDRIMKWSGSKPFMEILGAHSPTSDWKKTEQRFPTVTDMRFCSWASIVSGAKGLAVYTEGKRKALTYNPYAETNVPDFQQRLGKVINEVGAAVPWLISDELPAVKSTVLSGNVRMLERVAEGKTMTAVVNAGEKPAEVRLGNGKVIKLPRLGVAVEYY